MYRWATCPGSVRLSKGIPNRSSKYAQEGTDAHEWAAKILDGKDCLANVQRTNQAGQVKRTTLQPNSLGLCVL